MKKFLLLYQGPATPPDASHEGWPEWFNKLGDKLVDRGLPLAHGRSLRFVGKQGHLTAHREIQRLPRAAWGAHRNIRNHTYNLHLGQTQGLTMAALEQVAATLQAHLK